MKIVCVISGGVLDGVFCDDPNNVDVQLVDCDDLEAEGLFRSEIRERVEEATDGLVAVY